MNTIFKCSFFWLRKKPSTKYEDNWGNGRRNPRCVQVYGGLSLPIIKNKNENNKNKKKNKMKNEIKKIEKIKKYIIQKKTPQDGVVEPHVFE